MGVKEYLGAVVTIIATVVAAAVVAAYVAHPIPELKELAIFAAGGLIGALTSSAKRTCIETPPGSKQKIVAEAES